MMINKRIPAIDILKFLAVLLVMNSHMEICYTKYQFLSTGGILGDALFFFASGFTLFLGRDMRFDQWYKRRINRIYPSILAAAIVAYVVWHFEENIGDILIGKRYWFIGCIMIYYVFLYPLKKIKNDKAVILIFFGWLVIMIATFFLIWGGSVQFYSSNGLFRILIFFLFMLQGAIMGKNAEILSFKWWHLPCLIVATISWFIMVRYSAYSLSLILSIIPLLCFTYFLYCFCNAKWFIKIYENKIFGKVLIIVSQLCLEVYLIQKFIITDALNNWFPLNIPVIMLIVIAVSYIVKVLAGFISQTFKTEPYDWKKMLLWER